jgi:hypothetical protein
MNVALNHTIVWCRAQQVCAAFLAETLGLATPARFGPLVRPGAGNRVTLRSARPAMSN